MKDLVSTIDIRPQYYTSYEVSAVIDKSAYEEANRQPSVPPPFHRRFNIRVDLQNARQRFVNRIFIRIDSELPEFDLEDSDRPEWCNLALEQVAYSLGMEYEYYNSLREHVGTTFNPEFLQSIEELYKSLVAHNPEKAKLLENIMKDAVESSEVDLGIRWGSGGFWPSGAKLLDDELVIEPLRWLGEPKYKNVLKPFQEGLKHYLETTKDHNRLSDTITRIYESLEALAKIACENDRDLSGNREAFISKLGLDEQYKNMLKEHISYANEVGRHAARRDKERIPPKPHEVEAFIYTTGLFIRLAIRQLAEE